MAKVEKDEKDEKDEKPWSPDQPIPDEEGETVAQRAVMLERRKKYLLDEAEKKKDKPKKGIGW